MFWRSDSEHRYIAARDARLDGTVGRASTHLLAELERWVLHLPWVSEVQPSLLEPRVRRFAVICEPLDCVEIWLTIEPRDGVGTWNIDLVLPSSLAERGAMLGWAAELVDLTDERTVAGVATPTTVSELRALQGLLAVAYGAAFPKATRGDDA
jgi:hypothetical protein